MQVKIFKTELLILYKVKWDKITSLLLKSNYKEFKKQKYIMIPKSNVQFVKKILKKIIFSLN